uniref:Uncharacterized protein n=1 Tax=Oryza nivara TaxID=4536 RepID=A0A0E0J3S3_ORYNI
MEVAAAALRPLISKLGELLKNEYGLEKRVLKRVKSLETELMMMHAALDKVAVIPRDQLDEQVRIWADKVWELSYDMEDVIDTFMVRVEKGPELTASNNLKNRAKKFLKKTTGLFSKGKDLHQIANAIEEAEELAKQYAKLRKRYMLDIGSINANAKEALNMDPRILALYVDERELVGIELQRDELIDKLYSGDEESILRLRTVSIVGFGGLGKTTLAKAVYDNIKVSFDCSAFVPVSRDPNIRNIFKKIHYDLDKQKYGNINEAIRNEKQLIDELRSFLSNKRYLIVVDDLWEISTWNFIMPAFLDSNNGSRIITTSRNTDVAEKAGYVHNMEPLSCQNSKRLLYRRVFGDDYEDPTDNQPCEATEKILNKCVGVLLSIITMASLLVDKPVEAWSIVYDAIDFGPENQNEVVDNTRKILLFSYYDLPAHLKTCVLYLSIFTEDHRIEKRSLIWKWVAEGFVHEEQGKRLVEIGEGYFNQLINRNMIQPMEGKFNRSIDGCRIHDEVLDILGTRLDLKALPVTVGKLTKLMRLCVDSDTRVPSGVLGNLASLQELDLGSLADNKCPNFIIDLHKLTNLRMLDVNVFSTRDQGWFETLVQSVRTFSGIQHVHIWGTSRHVLSSWEGWKPPWHFYHFCVGAFQLRRLPEWVNYRSVPDLSYLELKLQDIEALDMEALARIPELRYLYLNVYTEGTFSWTVHGGGLFPKLRYCDTNIALTFSEGAMPMLTRANLWLTVSSDGAATEIGLGNLGLLNSVTLNLYCKGPTERQVEEVKAAWTSAVQAYPSRPTIYFHQCILWMSKQDKDDNGEEEKSATEDEDEYTREQDKDDDGEEEMSATEDNDEITCDELEKEQEDGYFEVEEDEDSDEWSRFVFGGEGSSWRLVTEDELRKDAAEAQVARYQQNYPHSWVFT